MSYFNEGLNLIVNAPEMSQTAMEAIATRVIIRMNKFYDHLLINGGKDEGTFELETLEQELEENPLD